MKMLPAFVSKPRSSTVSTRSPRLTLARIGLRFGSKASSVIDRSVTRTGVTRLLLHTNNVNGDTIGAISSVPLLPKRFRSLSCVLVGDTKASSTARCG